MRPLPPAVPFGGTHFFNTAKRQQLRDPSWMSQLIFESPDYSFQRVAIFDNVLMADLGPGTSPEDVSLQLSAQDLAERAGLPVDTFYTYRPKSMPHESQLMNPFSLPSPQSNLTFRYEDTADPRWSLERDESTETQMSTTELSEPVRQLYQEPGGRILSGNLSHQLYRQLCAQLGLRYPFGDVG